MRFCATVVAVPLAVWILPGVQAASWEIAWIAGALLGIVFLVLRPIIKLLLTPLNCLTFGLVGFFADVAFVHLTAGWVHGFIIENLVWSALTALIIFILREGMGKLVATG